VYVSAKLTNAEEMASEAEKLNVDSIIQRLLEGTCVAPRGPVSGSL